MINDCPKLHHYKCNVISAIYPCYKKVEHPWVSKIPKHWEFAPLKAFSSCNDDALAENTDSEYELFYIEISDVDSIDGIIGGTIILYKDSPSRARRKVIEGDVIVSTVRTYLRAISQIKEPRNNTIVSTGFAVIRPNRRSLESGYLGYLARSEWWVADIISKSVGVSYPAINASEIMATKIPLPPLPEQIQIARFLDYETARIDALIAEQQRLIELLKEKRQAVISHAVTQGLDPTAPMKDSGVEWLGKIPKHWEVGRISQFYQEEVEKGIIELPVLQVSIHHGVSDKELTEEESDRKINRIEDREKYKRVRPGDLVYNMMRAWQGGFGAVVVDGLVSPAYVVARPRQHNITLYIEKLLRTPNAVEEMRRYSYGITDFRLRLYWDQFKNIKIPIPPRGEIDRILGKVKKVQSEVDCLVIEAEKLTSILQERRSALISAAVTGKIDVRDWEPPRNSDGFSEPISSEVA